MQRQHKDNSNNSRREAALGSLLSIRARCSTLARSSLLLLPSPVCVAKESLLPFYCQHYSAKQPRIFDHRPELAAKRTIASTELEPTMRAESLSLCMLAFHRAIAMSRGGEGIVQTSFEEVKKCMKDRSKDEQTTARERTSLKRREKLRRERREQ